MELRQLELFQAVGRELHFGRAARQVFLSQPALSHQISRLERHLGVELFDRSSRQVRLTEPGRVLLEETPGLLARARQLEDEVRRAAAGQTGSLRIGFVGTTMLQLVPLVVRELRSWSPDLELTLQERRTTELVAAVTARELDVAFIYNLGTSYPGLTTVPVGRERVGVAIPEGHRLASRRRVRISELAKDDFVLFPRDLGPDNYDCVIAHCVAHGFAPRVIQEADTLPTILGLVAAGLGVAFASQTVMTALRHDGVRFVDLVDAPEVGVALAHSADAKNPVIPVLRRAMSDIAP